ncbi:hypothetical protein KKB69_01370 [Patescibacteria group bacterium]|nr:hypothetical protein [Patescibacteria group bacterium]
MNKEKIIKLAIEKLSSKLKELEEQIQKTEQQRREAPSAMQSWSDTTRFQTEKIIDDLDAEKGRMIEHADFLKSLVMGEKTKIEPGALVEISRDGQSSFYFISLFPDLELELDGSFIKFVSVNAPLTKQLLNKKPGDVIEEIKILSVK